MKEKLNGLFPILLTPFSDSLKVDFDTLDKLVEYYRKSHVDGLTCLGEVSEVDLLDEEEKRSILQMVIEAVHGEMPVIAGAGRGSINSTKTAVEEAFSLGASAALIPPPKIAALTGEEIYDYYVRLDDVSKGPIIILDNPSLGYPLISVDTVTRLVNDSRNIMGIKVEEQPSILKIVALRKSLGDGVSIYGATHGRSLFWEMERGIDGVADVDEALDFIRYYALNLIENEGFVRFTGKGYDNEESVSIMKPYGVFAVIPPFNFYAITVGMTVGPLITA